VQVLDLLRFRNQVKDGVEAFSLVSSAERTHNDDFASMGGILAEFDDINVELALIDAEHIIVLPVFTELCQPRHCTCVLLE